MTSVHSHGSQIRRQKKTLLISYMLFVGQTPASLRMTTNGDGARGPTSSCGGIVAAAAAAALHHGVVTPLSFASGTGAASCCIKRARVHAANWALTHNSTQVHAFVEISCVRAKFVSDNHRQSAQACA